MIGLGSDKKKPVLNVIEKLTFSILGLHLRDKSFHRALFARILSFREFLFQCKYFQLQHDILIFFKYFCYEDSLQDALTNCGDATSAIGDSVAYLAAGKFKTEEFLIRRSVISLVWNWYPFASKHLKGRLGPVSVTSRFLIMEVGWDQVGFSLF